MNAEQQLTYARAEDRKNFIRHASMSFASVAYREALDNANSALVSTVNHAAIAEDAVKLAIALADEHEKHSLQPGQV